MCFQVLLSPQKNAFSPEECSEQLCTFHTIGCNRGVCRPRNAFYRLFPLLTVAGEHTDMRGARIRLHTVPTCRLLCDLSGRFSREGYLVEEDQGDREATRPRRHRETVDISQLRTSISKHLHAYEEHQAALCVFKYMSEIFILIRAEVLIVGRSESRDVWKRTTERRLL